MTGKHLETPFPVLGIDLSREYELQPPLTTPTAANVRGVDPATARERGAARPGLSRWIDARVGGTEAEIQCLDVVVTADVAAVGASFETGTGGRDPWDGGDVPVTGDDGGAPDDEYPPDWVEHPTDDPPDFPLGTPYYPPGGSGTQPNPDVPPLSPPGEGGSGGSGWVYRQSDIVFESLGIDSGGSTETLTAEFNDDVTDNQLLVVGVYATEGDVTHEGAEVGTALTNVQVTDSLGNSWAEVESESVTRALEVDPPFVNRGKYHLRLFWTRTNGGTCDVSVALTYSNSHPSAAVTSSAAVVAVEYTGLENASPFEGSASASFSAAPGPNGPVTVTAGACPVGGETRLAVGFTIFIGDYAAGGPDGTLADGFTLRRQVNSLFPSSGFWLAWFDDTSTDSASEPAADSPSFVAGGSPDTNHVTWLAANAAFRFGA